MRNTYGRLVFKSLRQCFKFTVLHFSLMFLSLTASHAETQSQLGRTTFETTLTNGLKVIIREDHRAPIAISQIWYAVGSSDESGNILGVSHALEHMMFKGTTKVPDNEFTRLSRIYGGRVNAATSSNYTNYYQLYPKAYLPMALELEADRMTHLVLRQSDFATEMNVVMEERRQRTDDNPRALAFERFKWLAFPTSHARQPVIGYMKNLQNIQLEDLKQWYKTWYSPNHATLVIIGDVDAEATLKQVQKYFGQIPKQSSAERNDVLEFDRVGYRHMEVQLPVHVANLYMAWNVRTIKTAKNPQDAYALTIIQALLDGNISSRLQQKLVRDKKMLSSISINYDPYNRGDSLFTITALPADGISLVSAQDAIQKEIDSLKTELIEPVELERVTNNFVSNLVYSQDDIIGQAHMIGLLEVNGLSYRLVDDLPEHYQTVTPQDIQRVANAYFVKSNLTTLYLEPQQEK